MDTPTTQNGYELENIKNEKDDFSEEEVDHNNKIKDEEASDIDPSQFLQIKHECDSDSDDTKTEDTDRKLENKGNSTKNNKGSNAIKTQTNSLLGTNYKEAIVLEDATYEEQRAVVRFLWAKGFPAKNIYKEMFPVYRVKCLSRQAIHNWVQKFENGRSDLTDQAKPGRPVGIATEVTMKRVEEMIEANRNITINFVATALGCSHGLAYTIIHERLNFRRLRGMWVPKDVKDQENS